MAKIFEAERVGEFRYCHAWHRWMVWTGTHWKIEETDLAFDRIRHVIAKRNLEMKKDAARASFASGVEKFSRASRVFATEPGVFDSSEWLLNTPRGTVDLRTG